MLQSLTPLRGCRWPRAAALFAAGALLLAGVARSSAQTAPTATPLAAPQPQPPGLWIDGIHLSAQLQAGIIGNPSRPADGLNFGQLFTDHANQVQLNQLLLTANKPLDPKNP